MKPILDFFNSSFFVLFGGISSIIMIFGFLFTIILITKGIFPLIYRIGIGLSKREIAIFSKDDFDSLKSMLVDSKIFREKNIIQIHKNSLTKAKKNTFYLVHWKDFKDEIDKIIEMKADSTALIVYAPKNEGKIDDIELDKINSHRNSLIVNFRGRLLNDILVSIITTSL